MDSEGGESCSAICAEQPFDVRFHPTKNGALFCASLVTGEVRAFRLDAFHFPFRRRRRSPAPFRASARRRRVRAPPSIVACAR